MYRRHNDDFPPYWLIVIAWLFFWPAGVALLLMKLGVFGAIGSALSSSGSSTAANRSFQATEAGEKRRMDKYKLMAIGANALSIEHMASAVGISYESCLRDVQKMVVSGQFGADAYINYVDKTLILGSKAANRTVGGQTSTYRASDTASKVTTRRSSDTLPASQRPMRTETSTPAYARNEQARKNAAKKTEKPFGNLPGILMTVGIALLVFGLAGLGVEIDEGLSVFGTMLASSFAAGGIASIIGSVTTRGRANRINAYKIVIGARDYISVKELAEISGVKEKTVRKDIDVMLDKGMLTDSAYFDHGADLLILKPGSVPEKEVEPEVPEDGEDRYKAIIREIRQVNDEIPDEAISAKIDEMENLTGAIFKAVQEKPEKLPQIKSFMSYYLPTALKLLHSYAEFDKSGAAGGNVDSAKADIERILDMLVEGFRKQLDKLYEADALDISTDIDVLESMLKKDGLSSDGSGFGQAVAMQ